jgi:short-subunit dehydrogenase
VKTFLSIASGPGIGTATANRFAKEGFRVVLASRDPAKLDARAEHLKAKGYAVEIKAVDAGDLASIAAVIREAEAQFGAIDVLHFNAASMHSATIESQPADTFVQDLTINIGAALVATQAAARGMLKRGDSAILLTGGAFAVSPHPDYLSLSIGKAGIRTLLHALFSGFKERGVHIASVTVATIVAAESVEAAGVTQAFWDLYNEPRGAWSAEVTYPRETSAE